MTEEYVIDANVLFGAFISGKDIYRLLFSGHTVYLPDFALIEIEKYKERILKKAKLPEPEFQEFVLGLFEEVTVVPGLVISQSSLRQAYQWCQEIDEKDTLYVATAIELDAWLITSDQALYKGLKRQGFAKVVQLSDFLDTLPVPKVPDR